VVTRYDPDGTGGSWQPVRDCPKSNRSGSCNNCCLRRPGGLAFGAVVRHNRFGIKELHPLRSTDFDEKGESLVRGVRNPVVINPGDLGLGDVEKARVGDTTFAAPVRRYKGRPLNEATRRTAPTYVYRSGPDGNEGSYEPPADVVGHILDFSFRPVVTWEHPIDLGGNPISSSDLAERAERDKRAWDEGVVFPRETCEVPRLRLTDLLGLERIRRFATQWGVGVVFTDATLCPADFEVLKAVWPDLVERSHPYPDRKIRQVAVVTPEGYHGVGSLVGEDGRLVTAPLEAHGIGLVFTPVKRAAKTLFDCVAKEQPTCRLAVENYSHNAVVANLHTDSPAGTYVTYARGILGIGANVLGTRHLLVDANSFRSVSGFTPGEITPEEFARQRAEERLSLVLQNVGRALRGEKDKTVSIFILNADNELLEVIRTAPAIVQGSELPPVFAKGKDLRQLVDQADRWLAAGGGEWPAEDPSKGKTRKVGRSKRTKESLLEAAEQAIKRGCNWKEFRLKEHPQRVLTAEDLERLKARFTGG
jgi:hypothetical protein